MKKLRWLILLLFGLSLLVVACKKDHNAEAASENEVSTEDNQTGFNQATITKFFKQYPDFKKYESRLLTLYQKKAWKPIWYENNQLNQLAGLLQGKVHSIEEEGILPPVPYQKAFDAVLDQKVTPAPNPVNDFLISAMYFYYTDKVFHGFDVKTRQSLGWYLPRKTNSYIDYLDSLKANPKRLEHDDQEMFVQYYRLKSALQRYREMEKKSDWDSIPFDLKMKPLVVGDTSDIIPKIRKRLFALENKSTDSDSKVYDPKMAQAVVKYKSSLGLVPSKKISAIMLAALNVPISEKIKTIILNMERCRWIPSDITRAEQYIVINIPSYQLTYIKKGEPVLQSNVVVGKVMNPTVIFSGEMKYIVFSPYWNVPRSIVEKEIKPALEKNQNYLQEHNMERVNGRIRQKPGPNNSLGLVKFLFPNPNNIYLHDSPAKSLFERSRRAFSHGCVRVQKPLELAQTILEDDEKWTPEKVDSIMHGGKETWYTLKQKIPVYIGYLTTWVDDAGEIHFYDDIYKRDRPLANKLFK
ncbi:L,D-transpeptidase family protein [Flavobacterium sp. CYK-4]|uniref:L,D-transpeptidase family protein n=1 Tax=Flavobacterium lotistagni TaxID=2709660 RepID=UPI00140BAD4B|nr:L,D-transpeptidase family protein [Flavobacterium lotistagni]NHM07814.1 L,D-transpeptidase family protein [Flavobacterium lotistagni]